MMGLRRVGGLCRPWHSGSMQRRAFVTATAAMIVAGFVVLWSILPRFDRFEPPGPELLETDAPLLFGELRELAAATDQAMPSHVYLCRDANAFVTERGGIMGIGSRRVLGLGLPLLATLTGGQWTVTTTLDVSAGIEVSLTDSYGNRSQKLTL